jgi:hypothetical protein
LIFRLGPAGVAAIGVLLFCIAFQAGALRTAERDLGAMRLSAAQGDSPGAEDSRATDLERFYRLFPALGHLPDELDRLYGTARAAGVELLRADYRLDDSSAPLAAYRVTLPLRAPYPRIREFIGATLQSMPGVAIDALRFERRKNDAAEVDAQLRLTLYFRTTDEETPR